MKIFPRFLVSSALRDRLADRSNLASGELVGDHPCPSVIGLGESSRAEGRTNQLNQVDSGARALALPGFVIDVMMRQLNNGAVGLRKCESERGDVKTAVKTVSF